MELQTKKNSYIGGKIRSDDLCDKIIWLLAALFFATIYIANMNAYGSYILLLITVVALVVSVIKNGWKLRISVAPYHGFVLMFAAYTLFSALWAKTPGEAATVATTMVEILICLSVFYWHYMQTDSTEELLKAIMWGAYIVVLYTFAEYGLDGIMTAVEDEERFAVEFANINSVAMAAAMAVVINVHFWRKKVQRFSILFALPALLLVGASGTRKALVILLLGSVMVYVLGIRSRSGLMRILKLIGFALVAVVAIRLVLALPVFRVVADRMEGMINGFLGTGEADNSTEVRMKFTKIGWQVFLENPILGVGMSNTHHYLAQLAGRDTYTHNNFVEVLAGGGIIGFALYYVKYVYLFVNIMKAKLSNHPHGVVVVTILLLLVVMDWGGVTYYSKHTYFYLMMFFLYVDNMKKRAISNADEKTA